MRLLGASLLCILASTRLVQGQIPVLPVLPQPLTPVIGLPSPSVSSSLADPAGSTSPATVLSAADAPAGPVLLSTIASTVLDQVALAPEPGRAAIVNTVASAASVESSDVTTLLRAVFPLYSSLPAYGDAASRAGQLVDSFAQGLTTAPSVLTQAKSIVAGIANLPGDSKIDFPTSSLSILKMLTPLDSALASRAAVLGLQTMGPSTYATVIRNLAKNWNTLGWALPEAAYGAQSFATATKFVAAMNKTADQYDATKIAGPFVASVNDEAKACIAAFPTLSSGTLTQATTAGAAACCPLALKIMDNSKMLNNQSGFVNAVVLYRRTNAFLKQC